MTNEFSIERLKEIVDAWGASPSRWPEAERGAAEALLAASSEALGGLVAEAQRLDALLDAAPVEAPSAALMERLMAARPRPAANAPSRTVAERRGWWRALVDTVWPDGSLTTLPRARWRPPLALLALWSAALQTFRP